MNPTSSNRFSWTTIAAILILAGIPLVFFFDVLFLDHVLLTSSQELVAPWAPAGRSGMEPAERSFRWDASLNYYPRRYLTHERMMGGELPLWNPHSASGMPLLADFQTAVYYPVNIVLNLGDPLRAMGWAVFLHVMLAGVATFGFLRRRGLNSPAALFGGIAYMLNGFAMTRIGHPTMLTTAAWLPCLLLGADGVLASGSRRWFVALAGASALTVLSGFPQIAIHSLAALVFYLIYRSIEKRVPVGRTVWALVFAGLGLGLAGLQIIPTYEFARQSGRMAQALSSELWRTPAISLAKMVVPGLLGNPVEGTNWLGLFKGTHTHPNDIGLVAYVGILPLVIGLASVVRFRRDGEVRFFSILALLVVLGSMVQPVFSVLYLFLPGAGAAQADRLAFLLSFCVAVLGAKGLALAMEGDLKVDRRVFGVFLTIGLGLAGAVGILAVVCRSVLSHVAGAVSPPISGGKWIRPLSPRTLEFLQNDVAGWYRYELSQLVWPIVFLAATVVLVLLVRDSGWRRPLPWIAVGVAVADRLLFARAYYTPQPREGLLRQTPGIHLLRSDRSEPFRVVRAVSDLVLPSNINAVFGIDDAQGYNALMVDRYGKLFDLVERGSYAQQKKIDAPRRLSALESPILDLLNVKYVLIEGDAALHQRIRGLSPLAGPGFTEVHEGDMVIYRNEGALPRALWVSRAAYGRSVTDVAYRIAHTDYNPAEVVILEESPLGVPWWVTSQGRGGRVRLMSREAQHVVLESSAETPGWVRWAETYYPGWRVEVDGGEVSSWRSELALRAIPVPRGAHRIELTLDPASTRVGWGVSLFSLVLLLLFVRGIKPALVKV